MGINSKKCMKKRVEKSLIMRVSDAASKMQMLLNKPNFIELSVCLCLPGRLSADRRCRPAGLLSLGGVGDRTPATGYLPGREGGRAGKERGGERGGGAEDQKLTAFGQSGLSACV